jgi:RNA polymerase sigma-70 factor (ECF subfamily)
LARELTESSESHLVARAREGDAGAFQALLEPLIVPACRLAYSMLHDWAEAEDAVQDAALKAWRALPRVRPETAALRPWFLTIVTNQARSVRRRRSFRTITMGDLLPLREATAPAPEASADLIDLRRAMRGLDPTQRSLLFLRYCLDLPIAEAAAVLHLSPDAAKARLYRALRAIRPALEDSEASR